MMLRNLDGIEDVLETEIRSSIIKFKTHSLS